MSFILDALRKSESERRRSSAPMLAGVPIEVTRPAVPVWMWAIIGTLALAVVLLGGAWWNSTRSGPPQNTAPAAAVAPAPVAESPAAGPPDTASPSTGSGAAATGPASEPARPTTAAAPPPAVVRDSPPQVTAEAVPPPRADSARAEPAAVMPSATSRRESLPTVAEARAGGVALPPLTLELHVYHAEPASRWVYINGARYTEGRQIAAGPDLVEIVPEGVVIREGGREYLLLAQ